MRTQSLFRLGTTSGSSPPTPTPPQVPVAKHYNSTDNGAEDTNGNNLEPVIVSQPSESEFHCEDDAPCLPKSETPHRTPVDSDSSDRDIVDNNLKGFGAETLVAESSKPVQDGESLDFKELVEEIRSTINKDSIEVKLPATSSSNFEYADEKKEEYCEDKDPSILSILQSLSPQEPFSAKVMDSVSVKKNDLAVTPMMRMRHTSAQEALTIKPSIPYEDNKEKKTDVIRAETQRKWKQKKKIAEQRREEERELAADPGVLGWSLGHWFVPVRRHRK